MRNREADGRPRASAIREAYCRLLLYWRGVGVPEPASTRSGFLCMLLGWDRSRLLLDWREPFPAELAEPGRRCWGAEPRENRCSTSPANRSSMGLALEVNPAVLIPRPETELLAEAVMRLAGALWQPASAVTVPTSAPAAAPSPSTLAVRAPALAPHGLRSVAGRARRREANAERHGVADRIGFMHGDLLEPFAAGGGDGDDRALDILVSNPPYIPSADMPGLQREVREFEPMLALDGGVDGLNASPDGGATAELPSAPRIAAFEVGLGQARGVADLLDAAGLWPDIRIVRDYAGIERHVIASAP